LKALVYHGRDDLRYEDFADPDRPGEGEVRVRVRASGLCHTDFNEIRYGPLYVSATPHPRTGRCVPLVLGHEFSGDVEETGPNVTDIRAGNRVAVNAVDACRRCFFCRRSLYAHCPSAVYIGFGRDGGYAEAAVVPAECCHVLPPEVSYRAGSLVEPMSVALHAVRNAGLEIGSRVAVIGAGTLGLCTLQCLLATGAREVHVVETAAAKRRFAAGNGATSVWDPLSDDPAAGLKRTGGGIGLDAVFECAGAATALDMAFRIARPGGVVCIVAIYPGAFEFNWNSVLAAEQRVTTSLAYGDEYPTVISMLAGGRLNAEPLVTEVLQLSDARDRLMRFEELGKTGIKAQIEL
jgi:(R,R)-butanediol dehydrogenase / meso-butanediol dehydrogenase / diacetyl reductase